jgi:hypothetical protein
VGKDRWSMPYMVEFIHLPLPWLFTKFYLNGATDFPGRPNGQEFAKWNAGVGIASEGSQAIMRTERHKSIGLTLIYGNLFDGKNSGQGSDIQLSLSLVF